MKVCVLYSGGKDSNLALLKAVEYGYKVSCLLSFKPKSEESEVFHYPNIEIVELQAKALGLPLIMERCPDDEVSGLKVLRKSLKKAIEYYGVEALVTGAIKSTYQATRFQRVCNELDIWCFNPLWLKEEKSLLMEVLKFNAIFVRVAGLSVEFLGKRISCQTIEKLEKLRKYVNIAGEGGEYETLVLDMPLFKKKIAIVEKEIIVKNNLEGTLLVKKAMLVSK